MTKNKKKSVPRRYHIITIGCQMNIADSERLAAFLEQNGYILSTFPEKADLLVINTCGVRQMAEDRAYSLVDRFRNNNWQQKIVIMGCLSRREDVQERLRERVDLFLPTSEMTRLPELLAAQEFIPELSLDSVRLKEGERYLAIPPKRNPGVVAYVPIGNGCNNFCSYCVVPYARGREVYRPFKEIIAECRKLLQEGYREIVLVAQNVNSYSDGAFSFPELLEAASSFPGKFWLRFASSHPKDMSRELIRVIGQQKKICPHVHLAVQSGDDDILKAMNRKYTAAHFEKLVAALRQARPGIAITTDVIVGFPGETRKQFDNTRRLFRRLRFDLAYIARYSPRPGTVSSLLPDNVTAAEKKRREQELDAVLKKYAAKKSQARLGEEIEFLVEGLDKKGRYYGKAASYQTILARPANKAILKGIVGSFARARITKAMPFALEGELVIE